MNINILINIIIILNVFILGYLILTLKNYFSKLNKKQIVDLIETNETNILSNWDNHGFCTINNILKNNIGYINHYIHFIEKNFPYLICAQYNNDLVKNINRETLELVRNNFGSPFPLNKLKRDRMKKIILTDSLNSNERSKFYPQNNSKKNRNNYLNNLNSYDLTQEKKIFINFLGSLIDKLKIMYPNIISKNLDIFHVLCFYLYPNSEKQNIHIDNFYLKSKDNSDNKLLDSIQIFIPLHDISIDLGPTIFYKKNMIDYELLKKNQIYNAFEYDRIQNNSQIKKMFDNAKYQTEMKKGDIILMNKNIYHQGGKNITSKTRKVLLIQLLE